ncbi:hypothetical protein M413DRAFT_25566 [Hebeloma cylindrosporum]|uniref:Uncharacterized protein n=1 Tax=Hebeloma cylindrosporum TaxID=76867 RepID=A0A0C2YSZ1_HEBCY|nr:hypothetical protein M413DRAFT_25566 [Hebeloma cylindrosporum h7]
MICRTRLALSAVEHELGRENFELTPSPRPGLAHHFNRLLPPPQRGARRPTGKTLSADGFPVDERDGEFAPSEKATPSLSPFRTNLADAPPGKVSSLPSLPVLEP